MSDYHGYSTLSFSNPFLTIEFLEKSAPRIVRLIPAGTQLNLLAEMYDTIWNTPGGEYRILGGHRLWAGPEIPAVTYIPDHNNAKIEPLAHGYRLGHEDQFQGTHLLRQFDVTLNPAAPKLTIKHEITNLSKEPFRLLPWAITQFRMGGRALLPISTKPADPNTLLPNRNLVLWPYSRIDEKRFHFHNNGVLIDAAPDDVALKVGVYAQPGWGAIEFAEGWVVVKHFEVLPAEEHGDFNSNLQCYVKDSFIELETLGRLGILQPGQSVVHTEEWDVFQGSLASLGLL